MDEKEHILINKKLESELCEEQIKKEIATIVSEFAELLSSHLHNLFLYGKARGMFELNDELNNLERRKNNGKT